MGCVKPSRPGCGSYAIGQYSIWCAICEPSRIEKATTQAAAAFPSLSPQPDNTGPG